MRPYGFGILALVSWSVLLALFPPAASAFSHEGVPSVTFRVHALRGVQIAGHGDELSVRDDGKETRFIAPLVRLDTGAAATNRTMRETLETSKFPSAELRLATADVTSRMGNTHSGEVEGTLTLHGASRVVRVPYSAQKWGERVQVVAFLSIDSREFGVKLPMYGAVEMDPVVQVEVSFLIAQ